VNCSPPPQIRSSEVEGNLDKKIEKNKNILNTIGAMFSTSSFYIFEPENESINVDVIECVVVDLEF
jgi:hypothetical protein